MHTQAQITLHFHGGLYAASHGPSAQGPPNDVGAVGGAVPLAPLATPP